MGVFNEKRCQMWIKHTINIVYCIVVRRRGPRGTMGSPVKKVSKKVV
jgi:hypothetical protein